MKVKGRVWFRRNAQTIQTVTGFLLLIPIGLGIYKLSAYLLTAGLRVFGGLGEVAKVTLIVAMISLLGSLWTIRQTRLKDRRLQLETVHNSKKQKIYSEFVKELFIAIGNPDKLNDDAFMHRMRLKFMSNAILWAGSGVLKKYHNLRVNSQAGDSEYMTMLRIAGLLLECRKDLGLSNKDLTESMIMDIIYDQDQIHQLLGLTSSDIEQDAKAIEAEA
jgi:hypothetical protein